jgi:hypothetical protein
MAIQTAGSGAGLPAEQRFYATPRRFNIVTSDMRVIHAVKMSERVLTWTPAPASAAGTLTVPRHSSTKNVRGCSGCFEVEFDADRLFNFRDRAAEVIREIRQ